MNGAEALVASLAKAGIEVCFTNPGTSEMHFVSALDSEPRLRPILCLFEGVATGAADGYARMKGKPASTLLHLGAGLSNGLANLHNARRASSPIVNIVGDHATYHSQYDAPLQSDIKTLARPVSAWVYSAASSRSTAFDAMRAVQAAGHNQIATLILPADCAWSAGGVVAEPLAINAPRVPSDAQIEEVAQKMQGGKPHALLLRGSALTEKGLEAAGRIAAKTNARLLCDTFPPRLRRGVGIVEVERIPYFAEQAQEFLAPIERIVLVESKPPISFFAYPDKASWLSAKDCEFEVLAQPQENGEAALEKLADILSAKEIGPGEPAFKTEAGLADIEEGFNQWTIGAVLARHLPQDAIVIDDAATSGLGSFVALAKAPPHDYLSLTGGSIGIGMPLGVGAAVACPERSVIVLSGDGSAAYTLQALWTQAREGLNIVNIVFSNRSYAILNIELERVGANAGPRALSVLDLSNPEMDWLKLAEGFGVEAARVKDSQTFQKTLEYALKAKSPQLIEVILA